MAQLSSVRIKSIQDEGYKARERGQCRKDNPYAANPSKCMLWLAAYDSGTPNKFEELN